MLLFLGNKKGVKHELYFVIEFYYFKKTKINGRHCMFTLLCYYTEKIIQDVSGTK
ncbi:hypothetical protein C240_1282 [Enterococcus sp. 5H]|nr:hypothetical protein [Enterococcus sp. 5H]